MSLSNQKCIIKPTLINLHPNENNQELHYYPFLVKLHRCVGSHNTPTVLSIKVCLPNKTEDLNIHVSNIITGNNKWKNLTKDISCKSKRKFDGRKCNSNRKRNNNKCSWE